MTLPRGQALTIVDIKKFLAPVLRKGGARKAILFGSYARGEADEYSDIDLIIIAESHRPFVERFKDFTGLWEASPVKALEVLVYTTEEFETMQAEGNPFISMALEEGKII